MRSQKCTMELKVTRISNPNRLPPRAMAMAHTLIFYPKLSTVPSTGFVSSKKLFDCTEHPPTMSSRHPCRECSKQIRRRTMKRKEWHVCVAIAAFVHLVVVLAVTVSAACWYFSR
jgi:predicted membrane channel-forming protein YqfA (hemolysin III family)